MKYLWLLLLAGCANTDLAPDEFAFTVGSGDTDTAGHTGYRSTTSDSDSQWLTLGWTWYIGKDAPPPEPSYAPLYVEPPKAVVVPPTEPEHPKQDGPWFVVLLPYLPALAIGTVAVLNRMGKVDWVSHKEKHE